MSFFSQTLPSSLCRIIDQRDVGAFEEYLLSSAILDVNYSAILTELCANDIAYDRAHVEFINQILSANLETNELTSDDKHLGLYATFKILASSPSNRLSWT